MHNKNIIVTKLHYSDCEFCVELHAGIGSAVMCAQQLL